MTVLNSGECGGSPAPPPPPPPCSAVPTLPTASLPRLNNDNGTAPDVNLLMADIRNGITLKPTKTKDKSTAAFIKKSSGTNNPSPPPSQLNATNGDSASIVEVKDALQEELRNTLRRKVKKQDVERGDCTKKDEIEKAMEVSRTEVQLKINTSGSNTTPSFLNKDDLDAAKENGSQPVASKVDKPSSASKSSVVINKTVKTSPFLAKKDTANTSPGKLNGLQSTSIVTPHTNGGLSKTHEVHPKVEQISKPVQVPVTHSAPPKPTRVMQNNVSPTTKSVAANASNGKEKDKMHNPVKIEIKPFESSKTPLNGTLRKASLQKALTIDVNVSQNGQLKNTILSPDVKSGNAAIRPSQIKSLTQQGSHVSHTDIMENPKPINKSPISLVESPKYLYTPPTPKSISPASSGQASPRTPTRTTILDTKISSSLLTPKSDPHAPQKKLMISHPKASFTLKRSTSNSQSNSECVQATEPKPVFRILSNLEQSERMEVDREYKTLPRAATKKEPPKPDEPGVEPILTSYVSFAKELTNAPNNYPDVVVKHTTVGVVKQDLFFDNTNLRDIKIDIIEGGGQLKVVNK